MRSEGTIRVVFPHSGYGFIDGREGDTFFHVKELQPPLEWGETLTERRVEFDLVETEKGLRATNISPAAE